jgi:hypothetical protein
MSNVFQMMPKAPQRSVSEPDFGGGDGGGSDMESRVKRLEDDLREIKSDTKAILTDVAELKGKVSMLPGYGGIALVVALIVGLSTLIQMLPDLLP